MLDVVMGFILVENCGDSLILELIGPMYNYNIHHLLNIPRPGLGTLPRNRDCKYSEGKFLVN